MPREKCRVARDSAADSGKKNRDGVAGHLEEKNRDPVARPS
jgi:hypothetical protein